MLYEQEGVRRTRLLSPHRGAWVAVDAGWTEVLAAASDRPGCVAAARSAAPRGSMPLIDRVPREHGPSGSTHPAPLATAP
jgi:hypothetical protein